MRRGSVDPATVRDGAATLDCRDFESSVQCFALATGRSAIEVKRTARAVAAAHIEGDDDPLKLEAFALLRALGMDSTDSPFDSVYFFHGSRVGDPSTFSRDGILNLPDALPRVWDVLEELAREECSAADWSRFRRRLSAGELRSHGAEHFKLKTGDAMHHGPHAQLIRQLYLNKPEIHHDYLDCPEIVEDICGAAKDEIGIELLSSYRRATTPCIVKFVHGRVDGRHLEGASRFILDHIRGDNFHAWGGFESGGRSIPARDVRDVEVIQGEPGVFCV